MSRCAVKVACPPAQTNAPVGLATQEAMQWPSLAPPSLATGEGGGCRGFSADRPQEDGRPAAATLCHFLLSPLVLVPNGALWRRGRLEIDEGMLRQIFTSSPQFMTASSQVTTVIYALVFLLYSYSLDSAFLSDLQPSRWRD